MQQRQIIWTILTSLAISLVIVAGSLSASARRTPASDPAPATTQATTGAPGFVLRIHQDTLALFRVGSDTPYQLLDMPPALLSDYDRARLTQGIQVSTQGELRQLIEDLTS